MTEKNLGLTPEDVKQLQSVGITEEEALNQLEMLINPPGPLKLERACALGDGIVQLDEAEQAQAIQIFEQAQAQGRCMKFVPASGAASRMFKDLLSYQDESLSFDELKAKAKTDKPAENVVRFIETLDQFAFADELRQSSIFPQDVQGEWQKALKAVLSEEGLNYAALPKGLLLFHQSGGEKRTAAEEHCAEATHYIKDAQGKCRLHFTVSPEHQALFELLFEPLIAFYAHKAQSQLDISFSVQDPATDTLAIDSSNHPYRQADGSLLLRPGGHGALIKNVHDLNADIVFIKNIDNVVPDRLKQPTVHYKQVLGGLLVELQDEIFTQMNRLQGACSTEQLEEATQFVQTLGVQFEDAFYEQSLETRQEQLLTLLNRPTRVCGVVKNVGEPGGGPFWVRHPDGRRSLQIIEGAQVAKEDEAQRALFNQSTHFNPVDIVCALKDWQGRPFDLSQFIDSQAVFIAQKSHEGSPLKALERPGLWNGAMAHWNTVFVEVPLETFNPVKTVLDLLRPQHQG